MRQTDEQLGLRIPGSVVLQRAAHAEIGVINRVFQVLWTGLEEKFAATAMSQAQHGA